MVNRQALLIKSDDFFALIICCLIADCEKSSKKGAKKFRKNLEGGVKSAYLCNRKSETDGKSVS